MRKKKGFTIWKINGQPILSVLHVLTRDLCAYIRSSREGFISNESFSSIFWADILNVNAFIIEIIIYSEFYARNTRIWISAESFRHYDGVNWEICGRKMKYDERYIGNSLWIISLPVNCEQWTHWQLKQK